MADRAEQESFYEFHLNGENELMVSLRARDTEPRNPVLIYDGDRKSVGRERVC